MRRIIATTRILGAGLGFPFLFAVYTLWFAYISPKEENTIIKVLSSLQFTAIMSVILICFCLPSVVHAIRYPDDSNLVHTLKKKWRSFILLSIWSLFGPALWATAVALLEPTPATWLELGLIPLFTVILGSIGKNRRNHFKRKELNYFIYLSSFLLFAGVLVIFVDISSLSFVGLSILFGLLGALSTALAGREIEKITADGDMPYPVLLFARFSLTAIVLSIVSFSFSEKLFVNSTWPHLIVFGILLFALPNFLYVYLIAHSNLRHSAFMWALLPIFISIGERFSSPFTPTLSFNALIEAGGLILAGSVLNFLANKETFLT